MGRKGSGVGIAVVTAGDEVKNKELGLVGQTKVKTKSRVPNKKSAKCKNEKPGFT